MRSNHGYLRLNNVCHRFSKNCHIVNLVIVPPGEGATRVGRSFFIRNFAFVKRYGKTGKPTNGSAVPPLYIFVQRKGSNVIKTYKVRAVQHHWNFISASMEGHIFFLLHRQINHWIFTSSKWFQLLIWIVYYTKTRLYLEHAYSCNKLMLKEM